MSSYRRRDRFTTADGQAKQLARGVSYLRVSSVRQTHTAVDIDADGNSIATQREECARKAASMNVPIEVEFVEPGKSAQTIEKRPEFRRLLAHLAENPEINYVFVYARSRAFRNVEEAILTRQHLRALGVRIISTKEDFGESLEAEFMEVIADTMNDLQNKRSGEDIKMKMAHKARNGGTIGRAPVGYLNTRIDVQGRLVNSVTLDPDRAPLVRTLFELYSSGEFTAQDIAEAAEDIGLRARPSGKWKSGRPLSENTVYRLLADPYYAGYTCYKGELFSGRHDAIVSQGLFDDVQDILDQRSLNGTRDRRLHHYLKGLLYCSRCEKAGRRRRLIYTENKGRNNVYSYYVCRARIEGECDLPYLPVEAVERYIEDHVGTVDVPADIFERLIAAIDIEQQTHQRLSGEVTAHLRQELRALAEREARLLDALADGDFPRDQIRDRLNRLVLQRSSINERLAEATQELGPRLEALTRMVTLVAEVPALYNLADDQTRGRICQSLFERIYLDEDGRDTHDDPTADLNAVRVARSAFDASKNEKRPHVVRAASVPRELSHGDLSIDQLDDGSNKNLLVELRGFEPLTFSLRTRRATNCATAPVRLLSASRNVSTRARACPNRLRRALGSGGGATADGLGDGVHLRDSLGLLGLAGEGGVGGRRARGPHAGGVEVDGAHAAARSGGLGDVGRQRGRHRVPAAGRRLLVDVDHSRHLLSDRVVLDGARRHSIGRLRRGLLDATRRRDPYGPLLLHHQPAGHQPGDEQGRGRCEQRPADDAERCEGGDDHPEPEDAEDDAHAPSGGDRCGRTAGSPHRRGRGGVDSDRGPSGHDQVRAGAAVGLASGQHAQPVGEPFDGAVGHDVLVMAQRLRDQVGGPGHRQGYEDQRAHVHAAEPRFATSSRVGCLPVCRKLRVWRMGLPTEVAGADPATPRSA